VTMKNGVTSHKTPFIFQYSFTLKPIRSCKLLLMSFLNIFNYWAFSLIEFSVACKTKIILYGV
jgi:hypothetical protein